MPLGPSARIERGSDRRGPADDSAWVREFAAHLDRHRAESSRVIEAQFLKSTPDDMLSRLDAEAAALRRSTSARNEAIDKRALTVVLDLAT
jgi:hypothetical protein